MIDEHNLLLHDLRSRLNQIPERVQIIVELYNTSKVNSIEHQKRIISDVEHYVKHLWEENKEELVLLVTTVSILERETNSATSLSEENQDILQSEEIKLANMAC